MALKYSIICNRCCQQHKSDCNMSRIIEQALATGRPLRELDLRCTECVTTNSTHCTSGASALSGLPKLTAANPISWEDELPHRRRVQEKLALLALPPRPTLYPASDDYPDGPGPGVPLYHRQHTHTMEDRLNEAAASRRAGNGPQQQRVQSRPRNHRNQGNGNRGNHHGSQNMPWNNDTYNGGGNFNHHQQQPQGQYGDVRGYPRQAGGYGYNGQQFPGPYSNPYQNGNQNFGHGAHPSFNPFGNTSGSAWSQRGGADQRPPGPIGFGNTAHTPNDAGSNMSTAHAAKASAVADGDNKKDKVIHELRSKLAVTQADIFMRDLRSNENAESARPPASRRDSSPHRNGSSSHGASQHLNRRRRSRSRSPRDHGMSGNHRRDGSPGNPSQQSSRRHRSRSPVRRNRREDWTDERFSGERR